MGRRYEDSISHTLETAYGVGQVGSKRYVHDGVAFTANLNRMVALRDAGGSHGDHRPIRRRVPRAGWIEPAYELGARLRRLEPPKPSGWLAPSLYRHDPFACL